MKKNKNITVGISDIHGLGVITLINIKKGTKIKDIILPYGGVESDLLTFSTNDNRYICMDFASYFNHSEVPNIKVLSININKKYIEFEILKDILAGEEILLSYGKNINFNIEDIPFTFNSINNKHLKGFQ